MSLRILSKLHREPSPRRILGARHQRGLPERHPYRAVLREGLADGTHPAAVEHSHVGEEFLLRAEFDAFRDEMAKVTVQRPVPPSDA
ncbi:MAG: hypothetical protein ACI841_003561 [Planctomycetota bacterium]